MEKITKVSARIENFGNLESVVARVETERGFFGEASMPAGITVGSGEAKMLDNTVAVQNINSIVAQKLVGKDVLEQREIDQELMYLDLTPDRGQLGVNSLMPVSMAICRASANALERELFEHISIITKSVASIPSLVAVLMSGGNHGDNPNLLVQEYSGVFVDSGKILESLKYLEGALTKDGVAFSQGAIGSLLPAQINDEQANGYLLSASHALNFNLAFDFAATHTQIPINLIEEFVRHPKTLIAEDPVAESNLAGWMEFTKRWGGSKIISADDLTIGNPALIKDAVKDNVANGLVVKVNQSATLSELFDIIELTKIGGWSHIVSHRGVETPDDFIVDLAVGTGANYLKMGTPLSQIRVPKFERYQEILNLSKANL